MKVCPICLSSVERLHKKSHTMPNFMYTPAFEENHRTMVVDSGSNKSYLRQSGFYATEIICEPCEKRTATLDRYISLIFTENAPNVEERKSVKIEQTAIKGDPKKRPIYRFLGLDPLEIRNFVFSVSLKAELAERKFNLSLMPQEMFEQLRKLYMYDKNDFSTFPITGMLFTDKISGGLASPPKFLYLLGQPVIEFTGIGITFRLFLQSTNLPPSFSLFTLKADGSMCFPLSCIVETGIAAFINSTIENIEASGGKIPFR